MRISFLSVPFACAVLICLAFGLSPLAAQQSEISDQAISDRIHDELLFDHGVISSKIEVGSVDGVVTLRGEVNNILARERAARIAETVRGVRSVVNLIDVEPSVYRTDEDIRADIEMALVRDPATDAYEIGVEVDDGVATLRGTVDSIQELELARTVASGVRGVRAISDEIQVAYTSGRPDLEIRTEIEEALRWNVNVDAELIDVEVSDGEVHLSGSVGSAAEKRLAAGVAQVAGVSLVNASELEVDSEATNGVRGTGSRAPGSDEELERAVRSALLYDPRVLSFDVDVEAAGTVVTLRGIVDNLAARLAAEEDARNTVGVSLVDNRLRVSPLGLEASGASIAADIRSAFLRDPYVERFDVDVTVLDGTAYLYGAVDTGFEKSRAGEIASRVDGVIDVENNLTLGDDSPYVYNPYVDDAWFDWDERIGNARRALYATDQQIKEQIEDELWWSPFVDSDQVEVTVDDGIATLTGSVDSLAERRAATENAYEGGATAVDNDLTIVW